MKAAPSSDIPGLRPAPLYLIYAARAVRGLGDGFAVILLPVYLSALGYTAWQIGLVATSALLGSACVTLLVGRIAPRHDRRVLLILGAIVMALTGAALPSFEWFPIIVLVAFFGTVNPSSSDIGMLVPIEHASVAQSVDHSRRTGAFATYSLIGGLSAAAGSLLAAAPDWLQGASLDPLTAVRIMFYLYAALGCAAAALYAIIPRGPSVTRDKPVAALGPSRHIVYRLAALFSIDAFAGGFVVNSLLALWLFERFDLSLSQASAFFFCSNLLAAASYPIAVRLSRRFGLVNTMVFTHVPSSLCLIAAAFAPNLLTVMTLLLVRSALSQMDVPTRSSYVMAVVTPEEQPAAASVTAVPRSLASAISPMIAGALLGSAIPGLPLIICGTLKIAYDFALLYSFRHIKPPEELAPSGKR